MTILKYLTEYNKKYMPPSVVWRERRVWHKTPTGEMNFVKIKSLPPQEQLKYKPIDLQRKTKKIKKLSDGLKKKVKITKDILSLSPESKGELFDLYYGVEDLENFNKFEEGKLYQATLNSSKAIDMEEDENLHIVYARNVPVDAFKEYMDEKGKWRKIEIEDRNKKAEFIKFDEIDYFKIDLFSFKDIIDVELQSDDDSDDSDDNEDKNEKDIEDIEFEENEENEENIKDKKERDINTDTENVKRENELMVDYESYIIEKRLLFLYENNELNLLTEAEVIDPQIIKWANQIAKKLGLEFNGFLEYDADEVSPYYKNTAFYTDPITKSTFIIQVHDYIESLRKAWEKLKNMRWKFRKMEPELIKDLL